jgi:hypothetical protein
VTQGVADAFDLHRTQLTCAACLSRRWSMLLAVWTAVGTFPGSMLVQARMQVRMVQPQFSKLLACSLSSRSTSVACDCCTCTVPFIHLRGFLSLQHAVVHLASRTIHCVPQVIPTLRVMHGPGPFRHRPHLQPIASSLADACANLQAVSVTVVGVVLCRPSHRGKEAWRHIGAPQTQCSSFNCI